MHPTFGSDSHNKKLYRHIKAPTLSQLCKIKKTILIFRLQSIVIKKPRSSSHKSSPPPSLHLKEAEKGITKLVTVVSSHKKRKEIKRSLSVPTTCRSFSSLSCPSPRSIAQIDEGDLRELAMVRALERGNSFQKSRSLHFSKRFELPSVMSTRCGSIPEYEDGSITPEGKLLENQQGGWPPRSPASAPDGAESKSPKPVANKHAEMEQMKEKFSKLLLGEDMSGGGKGVSSALALSNAITNLAASVFGEQSKLEPMPKERKARWRKEIEWLLSVTDHIVEFVPAQQKSKNGANMEVMVTRQRSDLLMNIPALRKLDAMLIDCLDRFGGEKEFWYVSSKDAANDSQKGTSQRNEDKWWIPTPKVPEEGLSEKGRRWLQQQKDSVNQVLKAAMAINAQILSEMQVPDSYIESLPKHGRSSLGESIYKSITVEYFDPGQFLSSMNLSTEHKVLDLKNRIEASIVIWKRKLHQKDSKSSWVSIEKREQFEERAETILLLLKQRFPGLPQSSLDISKIQFNKDVGQAILESYSRILESLASKVMNRIDDVLYADSLTKDSLSRRESNAALSGRPVKAPKGADQEPGHQRLTSSLTLQDFMGWSSGHEGSKKSESKGIFDNIPTKRSSYLDKLDTLSGLRSPSARH